jgi:hypothetical protein
MTAAPKIPASVVAMIGKKFGRLRVVGAKYEPQIRGVQSARVDCVCDCGMSAMVDPGAIRIGRTRSCGCLHSDVSRVMARKRYRCTPSEMEDFDDL